MSWSIEPREFEMSLTSAAPIAVSPSESDSAEFASAPGLRLSSRALGWGPLNFERRDYAPASRSLPHGSSKHLIFVGLTSGRLVRESAAERLEHELSPGCVAVVPAHTPIRWSWSTRIGFSLLRLDARFMDEVAQSVFGLGPQDYRLAVTERARDTALTNIAGVLAREAMLREPGSRLYAQSLASVLAVHLLRHYAQRPDVSSAPPQDSAPGALSEPRGAAQPRAVADALAFMHQNYASELSLGDIAAAAHLSPFHLARLFKQSLGVSPHQYLIQLRVNSARWLLSAGSGERSLAELANAVGFADQSHLTRHFKRVLGVTPRQLRV
jgi:AraC family transcriptional regulator